MSFKVTEYTGDVMYGTLLQEAFSAELLSKSCSRRIDDAPRLTLAQLCNAPESLRHSLVFVAVACSVQPCKR